MRTANRLMAAVLCCGLSTPAFAGDLQASAMRAMSQQAPATTATQSQHHMSKKYLWPGAGLFVGGMALATYGFLHTSDGKFVQPGDASKLSNAKLGGAGLAIAAAGGGLLIMGNRRSNATLTFGPHSIAINRHLTW